MFHIKVVEKIKTQILLSIKSFFFGNRAVYEIILRKHCRVGHATGEQYDHSHCMLDT
jgi:hypothetical protein